MKLNKIMTVQKMAKDKNIKVSEELRQKLKILGSMLGYRSYDELINDMLKFYCEKKFPSINGLILTR